MKKSLRKMCSIITVLVMVALSTLPSVSMAEELLLFSLGGNLQVSGSVAVGSPLLPDYSLVTPIGLEDQDLTFLWVREALETQGVRYALSQEARYTPVPEDEGYMLSLMVTGRLDKGLTGTLVTVIGPVGPRIAAPEVLVMPEAAVEDVYFPDGDVPWVSEAAPMDDEPVLEEELMLDEGILGPSKLTYEESGSLAIADNPSILQEEDSVAMAPSVDVSYPGASWQAGGSFDRSEIVLDVPKTPVDEAAILYEEPINSQPVVETLVEEEDPSNIIIYEDEEEEILPTWEEMTSLVTLEDMPELEDDDLVGSEIESMVYDDYYTYDDSELRLPGTILAGERILTMDSAAEEGGGSFTLSPETVDFGSLVSGYNPDDVTPAMITVTNTGSSSIAFDEPWSDLGNLEIIVTETIVLEPGQSTMVPIRPLGSLVTGNYEDSVVFTPTDQLIGAKAVNVTFSVISNAAETYSLEGIYPLNNITGIPSGADKTAQGLQLPSTVRIGTNVDDMDAEVSWDVANCAYDPANIQAQSFNVTGTIILPSNVENPNGIPTEVSIGVEVQAGTPARQPYQANPANNYISGLESGSQYTTDTKLSFAAVGDGMNNTDPMAGDTRYRPFSWIVLENKEFSSPPYEVTFRMQKAGEYSLSVNFQEESYDGAGWVATGTPQDTKSVVFSVVGANGELPVVTSTPAPVVSSAVTPGGAAIGLTVTPTPSGAIYQGGATYTTGATYQGGTSPVGIAAAVQTGDDSPILHFVIILLVAGVCMGGIVIVILKRRR